MKTTPLNIGEVDEQGGDVETSASENNFICFYEIRHTVVLLILLGY